MKKGSLKDSTGTIDVVLIASEGKSRRFAGSVILTDGSGKASIRATRNFGRVREEEALLSSIELGLDLALQLQKLGVVLCVEDAKASQWLEESPIQGPRKNFLAPELRDRANRVKIKWNSFTERQIMVGDLERLQAAKDLGRGVEKKG